MEEYISKEEIIDECRQYANHEYNVQFKPDVSKDRKHDSEVAMFMCEHFRKFVKELPSADVRPNIHGHWEVVSDGYGDDAYICECSECKDTVWVYKDTDRKWNYCPNCGAIMDEEPIGEKGK